MTREPVHVWYCLTGQLSERAAALTRDLLSPAERERCDRFHFARDRRDYSAAHALLRSVLTAHEGPPPSSWVFQADDGGKPFLAPGQSAFEFNLAHTDGLVACALTKAGRVGIDAESHVRAVNAMELAGRYFSGQEIAGLRRLSGGDQQLRFIELWTLKEAYLKAIGVGLSHPLSDFGFELDGVWAPRFHPPPGVPAADWQFALFVPSEHHRMAVAVHHGREVEYKVREWQFAEDR